MKTEAALFASLAMLAACASSGRAPQAAPSGTESAVLVMRQGDDTVAVDWIRRTPDRVEGTAVWNRVMEFGYTLALERGEQVSEATLRFSQPGLLPERSQQLRFPADSGGPVRPATPYLAQVPGLLEQVVRRARAAGGAAVAVPVSLNGKTQTLHVRFTRRDSAVVELGTGHSAHLRVDARGRILGGALPAYGMTIERAASLERSRYAAENPHTAPAGAPYRAEEVRVTTPAGHVLAGTLTLPAGAAGPVAAVVTATGSGRHDRNYSGPGNPYMLGRQLADVLARRGIAVLRLDDRGVGASTGDWATATWADEADDLRAALAYLRARPEVDPWKVAIVGHSSGGSLAAMVAAGDTALRAVVLLATAGTPMRTVIGEQTRLQASRHPALRPEQRDSAVAADLAAIEADGTRSPRTRFVLGFDPTPFLERVRAPVFIGQGTHDFLVLPTQAEHVEAAVRRGGNADVTRRTFPELNHMLLRDPFGHPAGYARLPALHVPREPLAEVADWLAARLR